MSNTSIERGKKGSKFWIQTLVNLDEGAALNKSIVQMDPSATNIKWLSPLATDPVPYKEMKTADIDFPLPASLDFWPVNGPWWDAVGTFANDGILLVEAKAHLLETESHCTAKSQKSLAQIECTLRETHAVLSSGGAFREDIWLNKYYQLANRLAFLYKLRQQCVNVRLLLLNIVDDPTHIPTDVNAWNNHNRKVFTELLGSGTPPKDVLVLNFQV